MSQLSSVELKVFVPARDFDLSRRFYADLGFTQASNEEGVAYFRHGNNSFLLQDFYDPGLANNLMLHLLVDDALAWHRHIQVSRFVERYSVALGEPAEQPWGMLDFTLTDPSGVLWRMAQNI